MTSSSNIENIVREVLRERFDDVHIVSVDARPDYDADGDPVMLVNVIFDGKSKRLDPHKVSGVMRHILSKMRDKDKEGGFPVLSFIADSEVRKRKPEAV